MVGGRERKRSCDTTAAALTRICFSFLGSSLYIVAVHSLRTCPKLVAIFARSGNAAFCSFSFVLILYAQNIFNHTRALAVQFCPSEDW